ncbi:MAG: DNA methylase [Parcubacteria group bacterium CG11_big_fil_rev_8_21_14_0_20_39_22]|nr:MAG: DNA methylase [Parcubacteria group bacterium CG11_big_fil_rev_8_21_14_0_20_39_22]
MRSHYQKHLKQYSKKLRKAGNLSEVLLWNELKGEKLGYRFLRQKPILEYIVDFYCHKLNLVIEIDGAASHDGKIEKDESRYSKLREKGLNIVRVTDSEVRYNISGVVEIIKTEIPRLADSPLPLRKGE